MANSDQTFREFELAGWEESRVVTTYQDHLARMTVQSIDSLLDAVQLRAGSRCLDVATGPGYIAGAAAERGADAIGIDFSAAQVRAAREKYPSVRFEQADAESLPFEPDTFDFVVNGFGMCHLPDPDAALREACRVLKPGGRLAFSVWDVPERAVAFGVIYEAVSAHGSMDVGLPAGPNFFLFSDPEVSARALERAGFDSPSFRQVKQVWRVSDPDEVFNVIAEGSVRARATLRAQSPSAREAIKQAVRNTVAGYKSGDAYEVPAPAIVAVAVKSVAAKS